MSKVKSTTRRAIIIAIALIAAVALVLFIKKSTEKPVPGKFGVTPSGIPIPEEVHTYTGKVESVKSGELMLRVSANNNYLTEDTIFAVAFNSETVFERRILQNNLPSTVVYAPPKIVGATYKDIQAGDEVLVHGRAELTAKNVFQAEKVTVVESR